MCTYVCMCIQALHPLVDAVEAVYDLEKQQADLLTKLEAAANAHKDPDESDVKRLYCRHTTYTHHCCTIAVAFTARDCDPLSPLHGTLTAMS